MTRLRKASEEISVIIESLDAAVIMLKHKSEDGLGDDASIQSSGNLGDFVDLTTTAIHATAKNTGVNEVEILTAITMNMLGKDLSDELEEMNND